MCGPFYVSTYPRGLCRPHSAVPLTSPLTPLPRQISLMAIREGAADLMVQLLTVASPEIRAAAVFGLGCLVHSCPEVGGAGGAWYTAALRRGREAGCTPP